MLHTRTKKLVENRRMHTCTSIEAEGPSRQRRNGVPPVALKDGRMNHREQEDRGKEKQAEEHVDDWNLALDFRVFARHEPRKIYCRNLRRFDDHDPQSTYMVVECVEALTPLDMTNLGSGIHDATGHCVWTGAFLLIESLNALSVYFHGKSVVELGCGTGIGGIALLCSRCASPSHVVLTDADPDALELTNRNCNHNKLISTCYTVAELTWGNPVDELRRSTSPSVSTRAFDTVVATDVLYDIGLLPALFQTAVDCLSSFELRDQRGIFVLSHVPRACYSSEHPPVKNLEEYIVEHAKEYGFELKEILRPSDLSSNEEERLTGALNDLSLEEMGQVGAAILVFLL